MTLSVTDDVIDQIAADAAGLFGADDDGTPDCTPSEERDGEGTL
jgi:hypothetical protein